MRPGPAVDEGSGSPILEIFPAWGNPPSLIFLSFLGGRLPQAGKIPEIHDVNGILEGSGGRPGPAREALAQALGGRSGAISSFQSHN